MRRAPLSVAQVARNSANDAAFAVRRRTPDILRSLIDRPAPATVRPSVALVERAQTSSRLSDVKAVLRVGPVQAPYLSSFEFRERGDRHRPQSPRARDARGNLRSNSTLTSRNLASLLSRTVRSGRGSTVGRFFVGSLANTQRSAWGIWERLPGNRGVRLHTKLLFNVRTRNSLGLRDAWQGEALPLLSRLFREGMRRRRL